MSIQKFIRWLDTANLDKKPHQLAGMEFCLQQETQKILPYQVRGGIIADEMGLGKTILMLGCIISNFTGLDGKYNTLIVLPPSLLPQWIKIFNKFMGHNPLVYHGKNVKSISKKMLEETPVVVTTYGMIAADKKGGSLLWKIHWNRLIMDEAHHVRNMKSCLFRGAKKIKANIKWLVTGTPIQNSKNDLYALCAVLGLKKAFYTNPENIKKIIRAHILRRTKTDVGIKLPPLIDETITVPWSSKSEEDLARQIHSCARFSTVTVQNVNSIILKMTWHPLLMITRARQVCVFPHLLHHAVKRMKKKGNLPRNVNLEEVKTCSKALAVSNHIIGRSYNNRRKIVFCHYRGEIDLICALLRKQGIGCGSIDGRTNKKDRNSFLDPSISKEQFGSVCKKWNTNNYIYDFIKPYISPDVIVVQIQTACEGLNLQHFQEVYFTSPHWNPAVEDQAIARAHRIGQNEKVNVFRFIMADFDVVDEDRSLSLDNYCRQVQTKKRELAKILEKEE
jgi:SNF2 family DNA or RNA helicase